MKLYIYRYTILYTHWKLYDLVWNCMNIHEIVWTCCYSTLFRFVCKGNIWDFRQAFTAAATACQSAGRLGSAPEDCSKPSMSSCQFMLHALGRKESIWINLNQWSFSIGRFAFDLCTYRTTASQPLPQKGRNGVYSCHRWSFPSWHCHSTANSLHHFILFATWFLFAKHYYYYHYVIW